VNVEKAFYGPNSVQADFRGKTIQDVIDSVRDAFNLGDVEDTLVAMINGTQVGRDYVVQAEDRIEFRASMGTKG
jgi:hypothetical protein